MRNIRCILFWCKENSLTMIHYTSIIYATVWLIGSVFCVAPLKLDFEVHRGNLYGSMSRDNVPHMIKRDTGSGFEMTLNNNIANYLTTIKVGSDQQEVSLLVSLTESDTWVMANDVRCVIKKDMYKRDGIRKVKLTALKTKKNRRMLSDSSTSTSSSSPSSSSSSVGEFDTNNYSDKTATSNTCTDHGSFATSRSSTFKKVSLGYDGSADLDTSSGTWGNDTFSIGANNLTVIFAVIGRTYENIGILALGPHDYEDDVHYSNFPLRLKEEGIVDKMAYSLYLDSNDAKSGSVLFGALDHAKYTGNLWTFPFLPPRYSYEKSMAIGMNGFNMIVEGDFSRLSHDSYAVSLDPQNSISYFPDDLYKLVTDILGSKFEKFATALNSIPCPAEDSTVEFEFIFDGANISVPLTSLLLRDDSGRYSGTAGLCYFAVGRSSDRPNGETNEFYFGDNILRHGYFVIDLEGKTVSLAQSNSSDVENTEIISDSIPGAVSGTIPSFDRSSTPSVYWGASSTRYSTGSFSWPDYFSTGTVTTHTVSSTQTPSSRNEGPNAAQYSMKASLIGTLLTLLSYVSLI